MGRIDDLRVMRAISLIGSLVSTLARAPHVNNLRSRLFDLGPLIQKSLLQNILPPPSWSGLRS